jgi:transcription initiation factor IIE alpha subunit
MISKILRCISQEGVLRILNLIHWKKTISEEELNDLLGMPSFEIHKHINELINMEVIINREIDSKEVYFFNSSFVKKFKFFEVLMSELRKENLFALDLKNADR